MPDGYIGPRSSHITVSRENGTHYDLQTDCLGRAIDHAHTVIDKFTEFDVDVFSILGMRNLSAFIGELYCASVISESNGMLEKNPHQDGYPDLLLLDEYGRQLWDQLQNQLNEKAPFSPFATGGIEVKATCGSVPTPKVCRQRGVDRPEIGDQRVEVLTGYDWKAHHRETNNLIGIVWDFIDSVPRISAVFYSHELTEDSWGNIVQPRAGGGRTTSVSIMNRGGIGTMYAGWQYFIAEEDYAQFFDRRNRNNLLATAMTEDNI